MNTFYNREIQGKGEKVYIQYNKAFLAVCFISWARLSLQEMGKMHFFLKKNSNQEEIKLIFWILKIILLCIMHAGKKKKNIQVYYYLTFFLKDTPTWMLLRLCWSLKVSPKVPKVYKVPEVPIVPKIPSLIKISSVLEFFSKMVCHKSTVW